ncbi:precorrin-6A reductase [Breznakiellaceae bacterium SP9]
MEECLLPEAIGMSKLLSKVLIFGGTTEGRLICEAVAAQGISALYCVATELGVLQFPWIRVKVGRLNKAAIEKLIMQEKPSCVLDATHPYATEITANIREACVQTKTPLTRVLREKQDCPGAYCFHTQESLIEWLETTPGSIFAATGVKAAALFTQLSRFAQRVWFRLLPSVEGMQTCLDLGYPAAHLIAMQGPFSRELNHAMFIASGAEILVSKNSGPQGGFSEKIEAAHDLNMKVALLTRPAEPDGVPLTQVLQKLADLTA